MVAFFNTYIGRKAKERIGKVFDKGWLNEGEQVKRFEQKLETLLDLPNVLTTNSCSSALLLCLMDIDVLDCEVILPSQTFIATGLAILMAGGIPVFVDIDPNTGNLCYKDLKNKISKKTKAIIPVHWAGNPCDLDLIDAIAKENNLKVIQDAAHALGATFDSKAIAHFCDYTCYSFQAIKHLTTGDGGAICTPSFSSSLKKMKWFGIDKGNIKRDECGGRIPDVDILGFKFHMNDIAAAIGLANLLGYRTRLKRRQQISSIYQNEFEGVKGIHLLNIPSKATSANWMFTFRVDNRQALCDKLKQSNIPFSTVDYGIHKNPVFKSKDKVLPGQELFDNTQLSLPNHENISFELVDKIVNVIKKV